MTHLTFCVHHVSLFFFQLQYGLQSSECNEEYIKNAKVWLQSKIQKISCVLGFQKVGEEDVEQMMSQATMELCTFMHDSVRRGMENELFVEEERKTGPYKEDTHRCKAVEVVLGFKFCHFISL